MTKIWKESGFVANDAWVVPIEGETLPEGARPILTLSAFLEQMDASNEGGFGVLIAPADDVTKLAPHLERIALVALAFPAFNDGRAFSHASLLRGRLGYEGEVRAVGDVLIDQIPLMIRCGIDSFAVTNTTALKRLSEGRLPGISLHSQPAFKAADAGQGYSWRRKAS
jgi:uncharacterized protein (DUF934 family)